MAEKKIDLCDKAKNLQQSKGMTGNVFVMSWLFRSSCRFVTSVRLFHSANAIISGILDVMDVA